MLKDDFVGLATMGRYEEDWDRLRSQKPLVQINVGGWPIDFLIDAGVGHSVMGPWPPLTETGHYPGTMGSKTCHLFLCKCRAEARGRANSPKTILYSLQGAVEYPEMPGEAPELWDPSILLVTLEHIFLPVQKLGTNNYHSVWVLIARKQAPVTTLTAPDPCTLLSPIPTEAACFICQTSRMPSLASAWPLLSREKNPDKSHLTWIKPTHIEAAPGSIRQGSLI